MKNWKIIVGLALLVQSVSFVVLFAMLYKKKKSLAATFFAIGAAGGITGSMMLLGEMKKNLRAREQAAMDACSFDDDEDGIPEECAYCFGDCDNCESEQVSVDTDEGDDDEEISVEEVSTDGE